MLNYSKVQFNAFNVFTGTTDLRILFNSEVLIDDGSTHVQYYKLYCTLTYII